MLIEINYHDTHGSVCPFCGQELSVRLKYEYERDIYQCRLYVCKCKWEHLSFVLVETDNKEDVYEYLTRMLVCREDWQDHLNVYIPEGPCVSGAVYSEDEIWEIQRKNNLSPVKRPKVPGVAQLSLRWWDLGIK